MTIETINGVRIFLEEFGAGDSIVLVHGSWVDHMEWPFIVPLLAPHFRVTIYDRRGHSLSECPSAQGSVREDVADLAAIIERAGAPAHVLGISMGASILSVSPPSGLSCSGRSLPTSHRCSTFCATIRRPDRSLRTLPPPSYPSRTPSPRGRWRRVLGDSWK